MSLRIWLIDPQTQERQQVFSDSRPSNRLPNGEYDGDELRKMANEAQAKVAEEVARASSP